MRVVQSCVGKFHHFHLARYLQKRGMLIRIFSGYPRAKLVDQGITPDHLSTFPLIQAPYMGYVRYGPVWRRLEQAWFSFSQEMLDRHVASRLPDCDAFVALSGNGFRSGKIAQGRGALYVCDRGSTHIEHQKNILERENEFWGVSGRSLESVSSASVDREVSEYASCDLITVPSEFVRKTFLSRGVPENKLAKVPYGADTTRFRPIGRPSDKEFNILFVGQVSIRKGILYLLHAFKSLNLRKKKLTIIGIVNPVVRDRLSGSGLENVEVLGPVPHAKLAEYYSRAHVFVLPSLEEGLAMVLGEAMACGCPIIATHNTGAADLFEHEGAGLIIDAGNAAALGDALQRFADDSEFRSRASAFALKGVHRINGWDNYGAQYLCALEAAVRSKIDGRR